MARKILNNGDSGLAFRNKLNDNFIELFDDAQVMAITKRETAATFAITTTPETIPITDTVIFENTISYDPVTGIYTAVDAGIYAFNFYSSANWDNGEDITLWLYIDGAVYGVGITLTGAGNKNIPLGIPISAILPANATLEIKASKETGTAAMEIVSGSVSLDLKMKL